MKITKQELLTLIRNSEHKKIWNLYINRTLDSLDKNDFIDIFTTLFKEKKAVDVFPVFSDFVSLYIRPSPCLDYIDLVDSFLVESDAAIIKQLNKYIQKIKPRRLTMGYEGDHFEVVFNKTGKVVELHLRVLGFHTIPACIGDLTSLKVLDLSVNNIKDLPDSINRLTKLEFIDLSRNQLKDLPRQITGLHWLKGLDISRNNFSQFPRALVHLINLCNLVISNNQLKLLPDFINKLAQLEYLDIDNNKLTGLSPALLKNKNLKNINIGYNPGIKSKELIQIFFQNQGVGINMKDIKLLPAKS